METRVPPPHHWLDGLVRAIESELAGSSFEGVISGQGWLSLRIGGRFLWIVFHGGDRMAWLAERPLPGRWLNLSGRHARSPFPSHVSARTLGRVQVLETEDGQADGFRLELLPAPASWLQVRFFPRPGGVWVSGPRGEDLARQGRMAEGELAGRPCRDDVDFDASAHAAACEAVWTTRLLDRTRRTLRQRVEQELKRAQRRLWQLEGDLEGAREDLGVRALADVLAANLHRVPTGRERVELEDFEGRPVTIELDPARTPAQNLDRWYKRAGRAERKVEQVQERLGETRAEFERARQLVEELGRVDDDAGLDAWLDFAEAHGLDPAPSTPKPASERGRPDAERLPYWSFDLQGFELRVGRSARDNDELVKRHSHGRDLWLHAQGVPGSHVIVRANGREVPKTVTEMAARVAAHYSRAKTSSLAPVLVTECRHVRKPRKAASGEVIADRAKTLFVEPGIPTACRRRDDDQT